MPLYPYSCHSTKRTSLSLDTSSYFTGERYKESHVLHSTISSSADLRLAWMFPNSVLFHCLRVFFILFSFIWRLYKPPDSVGCVQSLRTSSRKFGCRAHMFSNRNALTLGLLDGNEAFIRTSSWSENTRGRLVIFVVSKRLVHASLMKILSNLSKRPFFAQVYSALLNPGSNSWQSSIVSAKSIIFYCLSVSLPFLSLKWRIVLKSPPITHGIPSICPATSLSFS